MHGRGGSRPREFEALGYRPTPSARRGGRNGVAVLARIPFEVVADAPARRGRGRPRPATSRCGAAGHERRRHLPAERQFRRRGRLRLQAALDGPAARAWRPTRLDAFTPFAVLGDFNVCPTDADLAPGALPPTDALVRPETRARFRALLHLGMTDALRALHPAGHAVHLLGLRPGLRDQSRPAHRPRRCSAPNWPSGWTPASVDTAPRSEAQPSDHTPVDRDAALRPRYQRR